MSGRLADKMRSMATLSIELPPDITAEEARLVLAIKLFEEHRISLGKASELAGYSKAAFMEIAGKHGVAVFDLPPGELADEVSD